MTYNNYVTTVFIYLWRFCGKTTESISYLVIVGGGSTLVSLNKNYEHYKNKKYSGL